MKFILEQNSLTLVLNHESEREELKSLLNDDLIQTDDAMYDFFENILANCEWEWINAEEIGALTDAPILGYRDENDNIIEAYGFMNYQVESLLERLLISDKAELQKG